jgi:hypothetical protein
MTVSHGLDNSYDSLAQRPRFGRYGKLAPQLGAPAATQVRAACDRCGSHLLAVPHGDGTLDGSCPVCLGRHVTAVASHHATA